MFFLKNNLYLFVLERQRELETRALPSGDSFPRMPTIARSWSKSVSHELHSPKYPSHYCCKINTAELHVTGPVQFTPLLVGHTPLLWGCIVFIQDQRGTPWRCGYWAPCGTCRGTLSLSGDFTCGGISKNFVKETGIREELSCCLSSPWLRLWLEGLQMLSVPPTPHPNTSPF